MPPFQRAERSVLESRKSSAREDSHNPHGFTSWLGTGAHSLEYPSLQLFPKAPQPWMIPVPLATLCIAQSWTSGAGLPVPHHGQIHVHTAPGVKLEPRWAPRVVPWCCAVWWESSAARAGGRADTAPARGSGDRPRVWEGERTREQPRESGFDMKAGKGQGEHKWCQERGQSGEKRPGMTGQGHETVLLLWNRKDKLKGRRQARFLLLLLPPLLCPASPCPHQGRTWDKACLSLTPGSAHGTNRPRGSAGSRKWQHLGGKDVDGHGHSGHQACTGSVHPPIPCAGGSSRPAPQSRGVTCVGRGSTTMTRSTCCCPVRTRLPPKDEQR